MSEQKFKAFPVKGASDYISSNLYKLSCCGNSMWVEDWEESNISYCPHCGRKVEIERDSNERNNKAI